MKPRILKKNLGGKEYLKKKTDANNVSNVHPSHSVGTAWIRDRSMQLKEKNKRQSKNKAEEERLDGSL